MIPDLKLGDDSLLFWCLCPLAGWALLGLVLGIPIHFALGLRFINCATPSHSVRFTHGHQPVAICGESLGGRSATPNGTTHKGSDRVACLGMWDRICADVGRGLYEQSCRYNFLGRPGLSRFDLLARASLVSETHWLGPRKL